MGLTSRFPHLLRRSAGALALAAFALTASAQSVNDGAVKRTAAQTDPMTFAVRRWNAFALSCTARFVASLRRVWRDDRLFANGFE
jgi:hypothetical protein